VSPSDGDYRTIFEASGDGLVVNDPETGAIVAANPAFCAMHGYEADELIHRNPAMLIVPEEHYLFARYIEQTLATGAFVARAHDIRKDGAIFPVEVRGARFLFRGRMHVLGVVRDMTAIEVAQARLEESVAERTRELTALLDVARAVSSTLDLNALLGIMLDRLQVLIPSDTAVATIVEADGGAMYSAEARQSARSLQERVELGIRYRTTEIKFWEIIERGDPFIVSDVHGDTPEAALWRASRNANGLPKPSYVRSYMAVPMRLHGRTIGGITLTESRPDAFSPRDAALVAAVASHAAFAVENARLFARASEAAALEERQRLARELHDSVAQLLFAINLNAGAARAALDRDPVRAIKPLDEVVTLARAANAETRALVLALRPETLQQEGLCGAITRQIEALQARNSFAVEAQLPPEPIAPLAVKEALYRISQEALHNVARHARPSLVTLRLAQEPGALVLDICDDGVGFDPAVARPGHVGQRSMRERAANVGGDLTVDSGPGRGTRLRAAIPLPVAK
jgi:PAS domain S-box-containing protein